VRITGNGNVNHKRNVAGIYDARREPFTGRKTCRCSTLTYLMFDLGHAGLCDACAIVANGLSRERKGEMWATDNNHTMSTGTLTSNIEFPARAPVAPMVAPMLSICSSPLMKCSIYYTDKLRINAHSESSIAFRT
jgi:hypothetical protein